MNADEQTVNVGTAPSKASRGVTIGSWVAQVAAAGILLMAGVPKLLGAEEAVHLFETLGVDPWGRLLTGLGEIVAVVLLLWPKMAMVGGVLGIGLMVGAIGAHLGPLDIAMTGPEGESDGGAMFMMALVVFAASVAVVVLRRGQLKRFVSNPMGYIKGQN